MEQKRAARIVLYVLVGVCNLALLGLVLAWWFWPELTRQIVLFGGVDLLLLGGWWLLRDN